MPKRNLSFPFVKIKVTAKTIRHIMAVIPMAIFLAIFFLLDDLPAMAFQAYGLGGMILAIVFIFLVSMIALLSGVKVLRSV